MAAVDLEWERFDTLRAARKKFRQKPSLYALVSEDGELLYVGESQDLWKRYNGGTGTAFDAALDGTGKLVFATTAPADRPMRLVVEAMLVYYHQPKFGIHNKRRAPRRSVEIEHHGDVPVPFRRH